VHVDIPKQVIRPIMVPVLAFILAALCIITIGETLINLFDADFSSEFERKELCARHPWRWRVHRKAAAGQEGRSRP
jgi:hypothetical protein